MFSDLFKKRLSLVILISAASCQLPTVVEQAQILEAHTEVREKVFPPASNMMMMEYSKHLEFLAYVWARRCVFEHPDTKLYPQYHGIGQNLALTGSFKPPLTESVCGWKRESEFYSFSNNTCRRVCNHYKKLVWAKSNKLGCAMHRCDGLRPDWRDPQYMTVCQYKPKGNYLERRPYVFGASCTKCPKGYLCHRNQCVASSKVKFLNASAVPECLPERLSSTTQYG